EDRRALLTALGALRAALAGNRSRLRPAVGAVLAALADDPLTARPRAELAVAALPWEEAAAFLAEMAATGELHAEALMAAVQWIEASGPRRAPWELAFPPAGEHARDARTAATGGGVEVLEAAFRDRADERLRRLALAALVAQAAGTAGWTPELRARLEGYRR